MYAPWNQLTTNPHVPCRLIFFWSIRANSSFCFTSSLYLFSHSSSARFICICNFFDAFIAVCVICRLEPVFDLRVVIPNKKNLRVFRVVATLRTCVARGHISLWRNLNAKEEVYNKKFPEEDFTPVKAKGKVSSSSRRDVINFPTQISICAVVGHEITTSNARRNGGILSIAIIFSQK